MVPDKHPEAVLMEEELSCQSGHWRKPNSANGQDWIPLQPRQVVLHGRGLLPLQCEAWEPGALWTFVLPFIQQLIREGGLESSPSCCHSCSSEPRVPG